jgi:hypothetical protein
MIEFLLIGIWKPPLKTGWYEICLELALWKPTNFFFQKL